MLFNVISGAYHPNVYHLPPERRARLGLGPTFQNTRLFASMTVLENVLAMRYASGLHWRITLRSAPRRRTSWRSLASAPCPATRPPASRKGSAAGWKSKAVALDPKILLLDEPHGGLNHTETAGLVRVVRQLHAQGLTILLIEHEADVVMQLADDMTVLNFGKVLCQGSPRQVQHDPEVIEAYPGHGSATTD